MIFLHNDCAKRPIGEDDFIAGATPIPVIRSHQGDVIHIHSNLGAIQGRALDPIGMASSKLSTL
jgi:hypothetical protein